MDLFIHSCIYVRIMNWLNIVLINESHLSRRASLTDKTVNLRWALEAVAHSPVPHQVAGLVLLRYNNSISRLVYHTPSHWQAGESAWLSLHRTVFRYRLHQPPKLKFLCYGKLESLLVAASAREEAAWVRSLRAETEAFNHKRNTSHFIYQQVWGFLALISL